MVKIGSGSYDLNKWLYGGYETDIVSVLYGGPGTGKTNLCTLAAVSQAKKGNKVIYIDSEGGFSTERVKQIVGGTAEELDNVLKNILQNFFLVNLLFSIFPIQHLLNSLNRKSSFCINKNNFVSFLRLRHRTKQNKIRLPASRPAINNADNVSLVAPKKPFVQIIRAS